MKHKFSLVCLSVFFAVICLPLFSGCEFLDALLDELETSIGVSDESNEADDSQSDSVQALDSINQTFDEKLDSSVWICEGGAKVVNREPVFSSWPQYGDALVDTHGKVLGLENYGASLKISKISVSEESAISFDYKNKYPNLMVYVDSSGVPAFEASGYREIWQNGSVILSKGTHSVTFKTDGAVYLDNITLAPNKIASVDISPKGLQETYVNGMSIQFSAKALRSDGSVISGKKVSWTSTGGKINQQGLFTPGTSSGTVSVTASIDGKKSSNNTVKIHGADYLSDSVTINGHEFTGAISNGSFDPGDIYDLTGITLEAPTPQYTSFTADGFFVLKGSSSDYDILVTVKKKNESDDYSTYYIIQKGDFAQRIWLRFGDGEYKVGIYPVTTYYNDDYDGYEGEFNGYSYNRIIGQLSVTNNTGLPYSKEDCAYLMPSYVCQSDDFIVSNAFNSVMAELPENATLGQKLQALYDWELHRSHYDFVSCKDASGRDSNDRRKKQDAVHVAMYQMAVCEGYANLYTALVRHLGVKAAYQSSNDMCHAWTELYYRGKWKLVDITWDDPVGDSSVSNVEKNPTSENYNYFLIDRTGIQNDHYGNVADLRRSVIANPSVYVPDSWY